MSESTVWISYDGIHQVYQDFVDEVDGETKSFSIERDPSILNILIYFYNGVQLRKFDYVICDVDVSLRTAVAAKIFSFMDPFTSRLRIVKFCGNANYYFISEGEGQRPYVNKFLSVFVDGGLANSDFTKEHGKNFLRVPVIKTLPPIDERIYNHDYPEKRFDSDEVLSVGVNRWYKGKDLLIKAFENSKYLCNNKELVMVGKDTGELPDQSFMNSKGYVEDIIPFYESAELYVQSSRADGFAVVVIEAMRSGTPVLVTETTGASEFVEQVDSKLVREPTSEDIRKGIEYYYNLSLEEKQKLSEEFRELSKEFKPEIRRKKFAESYKKLREEIEE